MNVTSGALYISIWFRSEELSFWAFSISMTTESSSDSSFECKSWRCAISAFSRVDSEDMDWSLFFKLEDLMGVCVQL